MCDSIVSHAVFTFTHSFYHVLLKYFLIELYLKIFKVISKFTISIYIYTMDWGGIDNLELGAESTD